MLAPWQPADPFLILGDAFRKTWFAQRLAEYAGAGKFRGLLRRVAPEVFRKIADPRPGVCFMALVRHIQKNLFPLHPFLLAEIESVAAHRGPAGLDDLADRFSIGIPYAALGLNFYEDGVDSTAIAVCIAMNPNEEGWESKLLDPYQTELAPWANQEVGEDAWSMTGIRPPRGRRWLEPWGSLQLLYLWTCSETGSMWLDVYPGIWNEDASTMAAWNVFEIEHLTQSWKAIKPLYQGIDALVRYVDARPRERLPLLAGALAGDKTTLTRLSAPIGVRTTLARRLSRGKQ